LSENLAQITRIARIVFHLTIDKCDGHELATALLDFTDYNINTTVNQY